jgi:hypothetical protein
MGPSEYITERQYSWARRHGIAIDEAGYTEHLNDNLFLPLTPEAFQEFPGGPAGQLDDSIHAAHSSAALVANVFFYWRLYRKLGPIIAALCPTLVNYEVQDMHFEVQVPIPWPIPPGVPLHHPQLDVIIRYHHGHDPGIPKAIAIESKFREPYAGGVHQGPFADRYLAPENAAIWAGLEPLH